MKMIPYTPAELIAIAEKEYAYLEGEVIQVASPTDGMTDAEKLMTLRANNLHDARATVHHELIPGHHLQRFAPQRTALPG